MGEMKVQNGVLPQWKNHEDVWSSHISNHPTQHLECASNSSRNHALAWIQSAAEANRNALSLQIFVHKPHVGWDFRLMMAIKNQRITKVKETWVFMAVHPIVVAMLAALWGCSCLELNAKASARKHAHVNMWMQSMCMLTILSINMLAFAYILSLRNWRGIFRSSCSLNYQSTGLPAWNISVAHMTTRFLNILLNDIKYTIKSPLPPRSFFLF